MKEFNKVIKFVDLYKKYIFEKQQTLKLLSNVQNFRKLKSFPFKERKRALQIKYKRLFFCIYC